MTDHTPIPQSEIEAMLGEELMRLHVESYGKGAESSQVLMSEDAIVVFLDNLGLQPNEEFLIGRGQGDAVVDVRSRYQQAIETTFRAAVERITGRRVISFASVTKLDPHYVVEIFRLGERTDITLPEAD